MSDMALKIQTLWPEIVLTVAAFTVMLLGLSPSAAARRATYPISAAALGIAALLAAAGPALGLDRVGDFALFAKVAVALVGLLMLAAAAELPDEVEAETKAESDGRQRFDPADVSRGEFFGFFLLSLVGAMLCANANDLIWLFLALELTSLPTYVMVITSRSNIRAPEAGVKYFFLGAMAAAMFLYGFALLYGATGTTLLFNADGPSIAKALSEGPLSPIALAGVLLSVVGLCFKIAAVPMHFYAADVYQGAATPVTAFLAFTPKAAGFFGLITLLTATVWPLSGGASGVTLPGELIATLLWVLAAASMFAGNTLALMQSSVKRMLAYSSIAHTGYMLVGLTAGPGAGGIMGSDGVAAILFYLMAYGTMNLGAFAVLGLLRWRGEEADSFDDLRGLAHRRPGMAAVMALCMLSLTGIPPLVGFWGKALLLGAAISAGYYLLAALLVVNSAIAAFYYLRVIGACYLSEPAGETEMPPLPQRTGAAVASAIAVVVLSLAAAPFLSAAQRASSGFAPAPALPAAAQADPPPAPTRSLPDESVRRE